jgi:hypothetical protein
MTVMAPEAAFSFTEPVMACPTQPVDVFLALFAEMPPRISILPSENCLYFSFRDVFQLEYRGCLSLRLRPEETGVLRFFYKRTDAGERQEGHSAFLSSDEGLRVVRLGQFHYSLEMSGRRVDFDFQQLPLVKPSRSILRCSEIYLGPAFDESGLHFSLLFDQDTNCFLWILNDDFPTYDTFVTTGDELDIGRRTKFAFLKDDRNRRRVLVGVSKAEAQANSYYDGPFDQLPDNYIATGEVELQKYIELNNPDRRGHIDQFGFFNLLPAYRVAIVPYHFYDQPSDLASVAERFRSSSEGDFYRQFLIEVNNF